MIVYLATLQKALIFDLTGFTTHGILKPWLRTLLLKRTEKNINTSE